jgi:hypothetical protein
MEAFITFVQTTLIVLLMIIGMMIVASLGRAVFRRAGWDLVIALRPFDLDARYPPDWVRVRRVVLDRDGYQCRNCKSNEGLQVHHIVPLRSGGTNHWSNLVTLCVECHASLHPHMREN